MPGHSGGGGCPLNIQHEYCPEEGVEEYKTEEVSANEEADDNNYTRDTIIEDDEQPTDLSDIMDSIKAFVLTVASLHLASGCWQMGGQRWPEIPRRIEFKVNRNS